MEFDGKFEAVGEEVLGVLAVLLRPPRGGVGPTYLHKRCQSVIFSGQLAGLRGMGWVGRRLCRPPAGDGGLDARP